MFATKLLLLSALILSTLAVVHVPLTFTGGAQYVAEIYIGNPPQPLRVQIDSGSSNLWVVGIQCNNTPNCLNHDYFNSNASSTWLNLNQGVVYFGYGSGGVYNCTMGEDSVVFGGVEVNNFTFGFCNNASTFGYFAPYDGILGVAYPSIARKGLQTLFGTMVNANDFQDGSFSLYMTNTLAGSQLILGGVDYTLNATPFTYVPVVSEAEYIVPLNQIFLGSQALLSSPGAVAVDSGTSAILLSTQVYNAVLALVGGGTSFSCSLTSSLPNIVFEIGATNYTMTPTNYVTTRSKSVCGTVFSTLPTGYPFAFLVGVPFMQLYYTHFNYTAGTVGFAQAVSYTVA